MKHRNTRITSGTTLRSWLLAVLAVLPAALAAQIPDTVTAGTPLTVIHYNDFHAHNLPYKAWTRVDDSTRAEVEVGGLANLKYYVDSLRGVAAHSVFLHGGDDFQGTPVSAVTKGASQIELLELMQPDAMVLGNHEFDYGADNLRTLLPRVTFPVISANLWDKRHGAPFVPQYRVLRRGGLRIGVIGLSPMDLAQLTLRENVAELDVLDAALTVRDVKARLERDFGVNVVIVLSHMGVDEDEKLAQAVEGIDVIVGGHSHSRLYRPRRVNGTVIVQAGDKGRYVGELKLRIDEVTGTVLYSDGSLVEVRIAGVTPDPLIAAKVEELEAVAGEGLGEVIGQLETDWVRNSRGESNVGNWQADVMREWTGADIAFQNSGGIRKSMNAGPITLRDIWEMNPFENHFVTFSVSGTQLVSMLRYQAMQDDRGLCQVSGVRYRYDRRRDEFDADIDGQPVDLQRSYSIVTNNYVAGHLYDVFGLPEAGIEVTPDPSMLPDREVFIAAIRKAGKVSSTLDGRITIVEAEKED